MKQDENGVWWFEEPLTMDKDGNVVAEVYSWNSYLKRQLKKPRVREAFEQEKQNLQPKRS